MAKIEKRNHYDNLSKIEPNLELLKDEIEKPGDRIFYVHFKHFLGRDSHYFVLFKQNEKVFLLQSAVFKFSFRDWIYPEQKKRQSIEEFHEKVKYHSQNMFHDFFHLDFLTVDLLQDKYLWMRKLDLYLSG
jgi:hypothetical protein